MDRPDAPLGRSAGRQVRRLITKGFTLVELLVVIGVSVLLPALNSARQSAKTIQCAANMRPLGQRSLGQGMIAFANEHGGNWMAAGYVRPPI